MTSVEPDLTPTHPDEFKSVMFRDAMARFPTGITVVTAQDENGMPHGFTVSAFCSVSVDPPLILVCIARAASSYSVFATGGHFAVSILQAHQTEIALRFATKGADRFSDGPFVQTLGGRTVLAEALATLDCSVADRHPAGDHTILVGRVEAVSLAEKGYPAIYFDRNFGTIGRP